MRTNSEGKVWSAEVRGVSDMVLSVMVLAFPMLAEEVSGVSKRSRGLSV
jgi:hypothetical protein